MEIRITPKDLGGTEFSADPHRLHLGGKNAQGVDRLYFQLPERWKTLTVTLHIRHSDGTDAVPLPLDNSASVPVGRSFTGWESGQWMLCATNGTDYTACTRPGSYDVYATLPTDGTGEEPSASLYETFVAQVLASAKDAAASRTGAEDAAKRAETAAGELSRILDDPLRNLILRPAELLCEADSLTSVGAVLDRSGTTVSLSGGIGTFASWNLPSGLTAKDVFQVSGSCTALSGGMRVVLNAVTKSDPDETQYYPLLTLTSGFAFDTRVDLAQYDDLDPTKPMSIRFVFTAAKSTAVLTHPTLSRRLSSCRFIRESGSTLGEVLQNIEAEITKHHPDSN